MGAAGIPIRRTARLVLRAFRPEDAPAFHRILSGKSVLRYFPRTTPPSLDGTERMIEAILGHWEEHGFGLWAMESASGELMGRMGLQVIPQTGETEIDYLLGPRWWGRGFATEAGRSTLEFGFGERSMDRVVGIVHVENEASRRVLEKIGMRLQDRKEYFGMPCFRYALSRGEAEGIREKGEDHG